MSAYGGYYDLTAAASIGSGNCSGCCDITITKGVTRVYAHDAPIFWCIGQGTNGTCGTVTIGGKVGYVKGRDYTYEPGN